MTTILLSLILLGLFPLQGPPFDHQGLKTPSESDLREIIGSDTEAATVFKEAIETRLKVRAPSTPAVVTVIAEQLPEAWLPPLDGVKFDRVNREAAMSRWETACLRLLWVTAAVVDKTLTLTVIEGNRCRSNGTDSIYERTPLGWKRLTGGGQGFAAVGDPCPCR